MLNISKIQTESNSQLWCWCGGVTCSCAQYFKDTNWKQFTTQNSLISIQIKLCSIFQRYKLKAIHNELKKSKSHEKVVLNISKIQTESNSQRWIICYVAYWSCAQYFKDTNWKQFTTISLIAGGGGMLCSIFQRYKLKAIHNSRNEPCFNSEVVLNISKIQTESNSQLWIQLCWSNHCCAQYFKDTNWKQFTTASAVFISTSLLCSIFQRYKLKAIHNEIQVWEENAKVVLNISKIQTESNSQLYCCGCFNLVCCAQYFKDTNWKQFTTQQAHKFLPGQLCSIFQRYKLKAIHNQTFFIQNYFWVVLNISKIQTESNSQLSGMMAGTL